MIDFSLKKEFKGRGSSFLMEVEARLPSASFTAITGPSGAGKTSLLRLLAGLIRPDEGHIRMEGRTWFDGLQGRSLPTRKRNLGFLFQDYALFPHMNVEQNLVFALSDKKNRRALEEILDVMGLGELLHRLPHQLSGGQQQRVVLARSLMRRTDLLLLDEPLSALDPEMRLELQQYLKNLHQSYGPTILMVSHDRNEILGLADQVIVLEKGRIKKMGSSAQVLGPAQLSGKFRFIGRILDIQKEDIAFVLTVWVGQNRVKVVVDEEEARQFRIGEEVLLVSKAFNPLIFKL